MKQVSLILSVVSLALITPATLSRAETVTLSTGETVEGKILSETNEQITIEAKVSASITDERVIPKKDILKIQKTDPEIGAFNAIKNIKLNPQSSLRIETYARDIAALNNYLASFPSGTHSTEAKATLDSFKEEQERVSKGEVKFLGKWLSSSDAEKRQIQIQGWQSYDLMRSQAVAQDFSGALNTFDLIEKKYITTRIYPDAVDLARQILQRMQPVVSERLKVIAYNQDQFKIALERAKPEDLQQLKDGQQREENQFAAAIAASKKSGLKWVPFMPRSQDSLTALQAAIPGELTRLVAIPTKKMRTSLSLDDEALSAISARDMVKASGILEAALKEWPQNEEATYWKTLTAQSSKPSSPPPTAVATAKNDKPAPDSSTASSQSSDDDGKPFFMTVKGALLIAVGVLVLLGGLTLLGKLQKPKPAAK